MGYRPVRLVLLVLTLVGLAGLGAYGYRSWQERQPLLPRFTEPSPDPRAPLAEALSFQLGRDRVAGVQGRTRALGLRCEDRSVSTLLRAWREAKLKTDAVSSASLRRPSARERNPQVRWDCPAVDLGLLVPGRQGQGGRLLLVFDSPNHPLRHVSLDRSHRDMEVARVDLWQSWLWLRGRYGPPHEQRGELPQQPGQALPLLSPVSREWRYGDLHIKLTAIHYHGGNISVSEVVEVPWPVRADAPVLPLRPR